MSDRSVDVVIVRGAPGVGKTSAVRALRKRISAGAVVEVDHVRGMIAGVRWIDSEHHLVALGVTRGIVQSFLARGFRPVVVVDTFSRGKLKQFVADLTGELDVRYRIASLHAANEALLARIEGRPANEFREPAISLRLNEEILQNRYPHEELIDTTELAPADVAERLFAVVEHPT